MKSDMREQLLKALNENTNFHSTDFRIVEGYGTDVKIIYEYSDEGYSFKFTIPTRKIEKQYTDYNGMFNSNKTIKTKLIYVFEGIMQPGTYAYSENFEVESFTDLIKQLKAWLVELDKELLSIPLRRYIEERDIRIQEISKKVDELLTHSEEQDALLDDYMTKEEGEVLRLKLDELESMLKAKIESDQNLQEHKDKELAELKQEFDRLRKSTTTLKKKNWLKKFMVTIGTWSTDPDKQKRLAWGITLLENIARAAGVDMPKISTLLPPQQE